MAANDANILVSESTDFLTAVSVLITLSPVTIWVMVFSILPHGIFVAASPILSKKEDMKSVALTMLSEAKLSMAIESSVTAVFRIPFFIIFVK